MAVFYGMFKQVARPVMASSNVVSAPSQIHFEEEFSHYASIHPVTRQPPIFCH
jgi:hypothetical protein